jgi:hypothetical protein
VTYSEANESAKLIVFVPENAVNKLREALGQIEGVATIGNYQFCTFASRGTGFVIGFGNFCFLQSRRTSKVLSKAMTPAILKWEKRECWKQLMK